MMTTNPLTITAPEGQPLIELVREFDAPPALVYRAHEDPALVARWLGPQGYEMRTEAWELRPGGRYRYEHLDGAGNAYAFNGVFHAAVPGERITQTFECEGAPGVVSLETMTFEALDGDRCRLVGRSVWPSVESRDAMIANGMERGVREGYERLDALLRDAA